MGLNVEPPPKPKEIKFSDMSRAEDLTRAMEEINVTAHKKAKQKQDRQEKEEKAKIKETEKRIQEKQTITQTYAKAFKHLQLGTIFLKYGALGQPKQRHVFLNENGKKLCWKDPGSTKAKNYILIKDIKQITDGR